MYCSSRRSYNFRNALSGSAEHRETETTVEYRIGLGHDTHRLVEGRPLILGGVNIPHPRGLEGHSDADALLHALTDALLGAAGLGDIGEAFPDDDPRWRGADSRIFLDATLQRLQTLRWQVVNVDAIIFAQEPKLGAWKAAIRRNLARLLALPEDNINVKAKTGERVGHIGRGEALAAQVVVLLQRPPLSGSNQDLPPASSSEPPDTA